MRKQEKGIFNKVFVISVCVLLALYALALLFLLGWGLLTSLKSRTDFLFSENVLGLPNMEFSKEELTQLSNYKLIFENFNFTKKVVFYSGDRLITHESKSNFFSLIGNTILYAGVGSLIAALVPAIVAYTCVKYKFRFSKILYAVVLFVYIVPVVGNYPSAITVLRGLGIYDTFAGNYIQKFSFTGMYFFVYWAFYESLSDTYAEAAEMDGASQLRILSSIILPLSIKMIASVWLILFVQQWNDYQTPMLYLPTKPTLAYGVYYMTQINHSGKLTQTPTKIAGCMMLALPILLAFIFLKDKLMGNVSMGGIKE